MLAKIELNHAHAKAIDEFIREQEYNTWLECKVKKGFDDLEAGRVKTSEEVIESAMAVIRKVSQK